MKDGRKARWNPHRMTDCCGKEQKNKGGIRMVEQEWMKFASTGSIQDYLNYKGCWNPAGVSGDATGFMAADREHISGSVKEYGADHSADGHGVIGRPGRGI